MVSDCDSKQLLHVLLTSDVAASDSVLLKVDGNAAAWNEVFGCDLKLRVGWFAEQFASCFVEEVLVHG
jgi:hypothetical protein